jgi:hypothetical protein
MPSKDAGVAAEISASSEGVRAGGGAVRRVRETGGAGGLVWDRRGALEETYDSCWGCGRGGEGLKGAHEKVGLEIIGHG